MGHWLHETFTPGLWERALDRVLASSVQAVKLIAVYLLLRWLVCVAVGRVSVPLSRLEKDPVQARRIQTLASLVRSAMLYALTLLFGILFLDRVFDINPMPLITAAGVLGLAVGFGAQKLVRDIIGGFFILLENQFAVGEMVTIGAVTGTVSEVGLRTTRLQDAQGKLYILSNGDISTVCNHSRGDLMVPLEISVAASADLEAASRILDEAGMAVSQRYSLSEPFRSQGVAAFDAAKVTLRVVGGVKPQEQERVLLDLREEVRRRLTESGIPFV